MRVTTAFNRLLGLPGASVIDVSFGGEGVIVTVRLRRRRRVCARCGQTGRQLVIRDRRVKRWRHLDLGSTRCVIECELRLLRCPDCRSCGPSRCRGRGRAPITPATSKTSSRGWRSRWPRPRSPSCCGSAGTPIGAIVERVVADHWTTTASAGLVAIGCDEISYRRGQRYLTSVVDHQTRRDRVVLAGPQRPDIAGVLRRARPAATRSRSGPSRSTCRGSYAKAIRDNVPGAEICFDPFHVVRLGAARRRSGPPRRVERPRPLAHARRASGSRDTRWSLLKAPTSSPSASSRCSARSPHANKAMFRAFLIKEELRLLYQLEDPRARARAPRRLARLGIHDRGCGRSSSSRARSAATAPASSPRSDSASPTAASRASTAASASSATAASASTPPHRSSPSSTCAARGIVIDLPR